MGDPIFNIILYCALLIFECHWCSVRASACMYDMPVSTRGVGMDSRYGSSAAPERPVPAKWPFVHCCFRYQLDFHLFPFSEPGDNKICISYKEYSCYSHLERSSISVPFICILLITV